MGCGAGATRGLKLDDDPGRATSPAQTRRSPATTPQGEPLTPCLQAQTTEPVLQHLEAHERSETPSRQASDVWCSPTHEISRHLHQVSATKVSLEEFKPRLQGYVPDHHPQASKFRRTLMDCVDLLARGVGGVILAIVDKELVKDLQFAYLDNGLLMSLCREVALNIHDQAAHFEAMLKFFSLHSSTDRWEQNDLEGLAVHLPKGSAALLAPLEGNPKDGAFVLSHSGTVVAAAGHLRYSSERYQLLRADGHSCGTRHAAALALAEWLGSCNRLGAVFVRSDGGGVHAMLPQGPGEAPLAMHFDSLRHRTQKEMLDLFRKRIMEHGRRMHKVQAGMIRPGRRGERVVTCVNGRILSEVTIADDTSMVIRANTESKELYVLSREKFEENWEPVGQENREGGNKEFKMHKPRPGIEKWIYKITTADLELVPTGFFEASWGAVQPMREGDFLAMPAPEERATEVYLMDPDCVSCYVACGEEGEELQRACTPAQHRTQQEMLDLFKERIIRQGRLVCKVEPCMSRPGKRGERVVTCVTGRVTSDVTITDDTSMVVRAPTMEQELYVLTRTKFLANWMSEGIELDSSTPVNRLLAVQGFKHYKPKPNLKWAYTVTPDDMELIPTGWFYSSWGALQPIQAGDCLAMPAPEDRATEVYLMPSEVLTCYQEVSDNHEVKASQEQYISQEEMLRLFAGRVRTRGKLKIKRRSGMMRPGRRGDRVVTYVNGRVISDVVIDDDTTMVVRAPTVDHEEYVLPREKFEANWESEGESLDLQRNPEMAQLQARGFRLHRPKPNKKWVYRLEVEDLELVPSRQFVASWGAVQPLREGDCLAMPASESKQQEVYLMPTEVLDCYEDCPEEDVTSACSPKTED